MRHGALPGVSLGVRSLVLPVSQVGGVQLPGGGPWLGQRQRQRPSWQRRASQAFRGGPLALVFRCRQIKSLKCLKYKTHAGARAAKNVSKGSKGLTVSLWRGLEAREARESSSLGNRCIPASLRGPGQIPAGSLGKEMI